MSRLRVFAYNVRFGDAILVEVPERKGRREVVRHILIDVGNVLSGAGGERKVFRPVLEDIQARLGDKPVDLYVMTHEHLDHVQGLPLAARLGLPIQVDYAWLTASAEDDYYRRFPEAARRLRLARSQYERARLAAEARGLLGMAAVRAFVQNNDPVTTRECVAFLKGTATKRTSYVHRGFQPVAGRNHPFTEARLSVWAPEADTSSYYGRTKPFLDHAADRPRRARPPPGVDGRAFRELMEFLEAGLGDSMLAIDRAANNTSVVLALEWRGWRLLFPGDAELGSWSTMDRLGVLRPVHLLKVGHHGSRNGTPPDSVLEQLLPLVRSDPRPRYALVSTWPETYAGVPDALTMRRLARRVDRVVSTRSARSGGCVTIELDG